MSLTALALVAGLGLSQATDPSAAAPPLESGASPAALDWDRLPPAIHRFDPARAAAAAAADHRAGSIERLLERRLPALERARRERPGRWLVRWNEDTLAARRLITDALRLDGAAPEGSESVASLESLDERARGLLAGLADLLALDAAVVADPERLVLEGAIPVGERLRVLRYRQRHDGVDVWGSRVDLLLSSDDRVLQIANDTLPSAWLASAVSTSSWLDAGSAAVRARAAMSDLPQEPPDARLWIVPLARSAAIGAAPGAGPAAFPGSAGLLPVLAWQLDFPPGPESWPRVFVAAARQTPVAAGTVLGRMDRDSWGTRIHGRVDGYASDNLLPDAPWNQPSTRPLPRLRVDGTTFRAHSPETRDLESFTDDDGGFFFDIGADEVAHLRFRLDGAYCVVRTVTGKEVSDELLAFTPEPLRIALNASPNEFATSQINAYLETTRSHDFLRQAAPWFTPLDVRVEARVNLDMPCRSRFRPQDDGVIEFGRAGACANFAYGTWIHHEYGHVAVWKAFGDRPIMPAYNEGMADALALVITGQPLIGEAFDGNAPDGDGRVKVSRDLSQTTARYPDDLLRWPHQAGLIVGTSMWRLLEGLRARSEAGSPEADLEARLLLGRMLIASAQLAPPRIGPDLVLDFLLVDDDNDDIFDGTPHAQEIVDAFAVAGLLPPAAIEIEHEPVAEVLPPDGAPIRIAARASTPLAFLEPVELAVHYSVDNGNTYATASLAPEDGSDLRAVELPAPPAGATLRYFIAAQARHGVSRREPDGAPAFGVHVTAVADVHEVFRDDDPGVWAHGTLANGVDDNQDDWQWGRPGIGQSDPRALIDGNLVDPDESFSQDGHWGNDLSLDDLSDKLYAESSWNFLESPSIDCSGRFGIHLRYRVWLSADRADRLRVLVNDAEVFASSGERDRFDSRWTLVDHDISALADDRAEVRIRFELESDSYAAAGGWNVDDVRVLSLSTEPGSGPALASIEPTWAGVGGGESFTLRGEQLDHSATPIVYFAGRPATAVEVIDGGAIRGVVPPGRAAGVALVTLSAGAAQASLPGAFTYFGPPAIDRVLPEIGGIEGGALLSVNGRNFTPDGTTRLLVGDTEIDAETVSPNIVVGFLPARAAPGRVAIAVETPLGRSTLANGFMYTAPPVIRKLDPDYAVVGMRLLFTILGDNFSTETGALEVRFGAAPAAGILVIDEGTIIGSVPPSDTAGAVTVSVVTPGGEAVVTDGFRYVEAADVQFRRGDANPDGILDISDASTILGDLFLGAPKLTCRDAADVNDDGILDISDAVYLLAFLFTGGPDPPPPHPAPGVDPTAEDGIACENGV